LAAKNPPEHSQEQQYREEAARLAQLPAAEQRAILAWPRDISGAACC